MKKPALIQVILTFSLLLCYCSSPEKDDPADGGETYQWSKTPCPGKGYFSTVVENNSENLFASNDQGVFRSQDFGDTWTPVWTGIDSAVFNYSRSFLKTGFGNRLLFGTGRGLYISANSGDSWSRAAFFGTAVIDDALFTDAGEIYLSTEKGIYRSRDTLLTWDSLSYVNGYVKCLARDSAGRIYAGCGSGMGLHRSADNGRTWTRINTDNNDVNVVTFRGGDILIGTLRGMYLSNDDGRTWEKAVGIDGILMEILSVNDIIACDASTAFAATSSGVAGCRYADLDGWEKRGLDLIFVNDILQSRNGPFYAATDSGLYTGIPFNVW